MGCGLCAVVSSTVREVPPCGGMSTWGNGVLRCGGEGQVGVQVLRKPSSTHMSYLVHVCHRHSIARRETSTVCNWPTKLFCCVSTQQRSPAARA